MTAHEQRLLARLLAVAKDRLTEAGHRAIVVTDASSGHCRYTKSDPVEVGNRVEYRSRVYYCGPKCRELQAVIAEAEALLGETAVVQLELVS